MSPINTIDAIVLTVIGLSAIVALFRGFVRELLSLAALVLAVSITVAFTDELSAVMSGRFENPWVAYGLAGITLFFGSLITLGIVNHFIIQAVKESEFKAFDRSLGLLFGLLRGAFVVSLGFLASTILLDGEEDYPAWLREAKTLGAMQLGAEVLSGLAPEYTQGLRQIGRQSKEKAEEKGDAVNTLRKTLEPRDASPPPAPKPL